MTGFASRRGAGLGHVWAWEIRSVNGKGLDLRLRLPEGIEGLEAGVRAAVGRVAQRGNVSVSLRLDREGGAEEMRVAPQGLGAALAALAEVTAAAREAGVPLAPMTAAQILTLRGVTETAARGGAEETGALLAALLADFELLLTDFTAMRQAEGQALGAVLAAQLDRIEGLTTEAAAAAEARRPAAAAALAEALSRVMGAVEADPARVAQELALIAVKSDVTEELDRLGAHLSAARALLAAPDPVGRKFEFLVQEFLREANTLCSKSGAAALTRIGLDLKHAIDQMREQIQNVE